MADYRLTEFAFIEITSILEKSFNLHGEGARHRYEALLKAAMRRAAENPRGVLTRDCGKFLPGMRSLHIRHARNDSLAGRVQSPVHIIYYLEKRSGLIEIVRVLHESMEPSRRFGGSED